MLTTQGNRDVKEQVIPLIPITEKQDSGYNKDLISNKEILRSFPSSSPSPKNDTTVKWIDPKELQPQATSNSPLSDLKKNSLLFLNALEDSSASKAPSTQGTLNNVLLIPAETMFFDQKQKPLNQ